MNFKKLVITSSLAVCSLFAGTYSVDKSHSNVGFKVKHMMISNVSGKFTNFTGSFEYDEKTKMLKTLVANVETKSINTQNEKRDNHLKESDFFAVNKYPQITFELAKIQDDMAYGKLTMRGVTKEVKLDFENNGSIVDPWGNTRVGLTLSGKVNRYDYGIKYNSVLEAGGVAVGKIVKLDIEIEGILKK